MKYELDESTATYFKTPTQSRTLCRIKALKDFADIKAGDLGGYIEDYRNLSHDGNCWIYDNAKVMGSASVKGDAKIKNEAIVSQKATVYDGAIVKDHATVSGGATVRVMALISENATIDRAAICSGNAHIKGHAHITEQAHVADEARIEGKATISGHAKLKDSVRIKDKAIVTEHANLKGRATIQDKANIKGYALIGGNTTIKGNVTIDGSTIITSDAVIASDYDYMVIKNIYGETMAYTTSNKLWNVNYLNRTSKDLIAKGYEESQAKGQIYEQCVAFAESQFKAQEHQNPKYEWLSDDTVTVNNVTLRRIRALKDFGTIKKGTLGGYIESNNNLSHSGTAWVHDTAKITPMSNSRMSFSTPLRTLTASSISFKRSLKESPKSPSPKASLVLANSL
jgi:hypothetical protein